MPEFINHTLSIQLTPRRNWTALGPGWAVLASFLVAGALRFEPDFWVLNAPQMVKLLLLWLLADPVLGTIWQMTVERGFWYKFQQTWRSFRAGKLPLLPYTQPRTAAYRASVRLATWQSLSDYGSQTVTVLLLVALGLGAVLGRAATGYVVASLLLAGWLGQQRPPFTGPGRVFWVSVATFLLPYTAGLAVFGAALQAPALLGGCYWLVYLGILRLSVGEKWGEPPVILGQAVAAILLLALFKPVAAVIVALSTVFTLLLRLQIQSETPEQKQNLAAAVTPFALIGLLVATVMAGGIG